MWHFPSWISLHFPQAVHPWTTLLPNWIISVSIPCDCKTLKTSFIRITVFPFLRGLPLNATTFMIELLNDWMIELLNDWNFILILVIFAIQYLNCFDLEVLQSLIMNESLFKFMYYWLKTYAIIFAPIFNAFKRNSCGSLWTSISSQPSPRSHS